MAKTVLITGGAGFIGSHLCDRLIAQGHRVIVLDNLSSSSEDNIAHLQGTALFEWYLHDVTNPYDLWVDEIYHMACPASPPRYQADPVWTLKTCVFGTFNALELARRCGARVLIASTSEVYGDPHVHPQWEEYWGNVNPIGPRACYDEGKRCAETLAVEFAKQHGVDVRIARIFNTYGPRLHPQDGRVVSNMILQALDGLPLTVYGDGSQTRSFCYIDDMVRGLIMLMASSLQAWPVNLGNPDERRIDELAATILTLTGRDLPVEYRPLPTDDPVRRRPDISRARAELGWQPKIALADGLRATVEHYEGQRTAQRHARRPSRAATRRPAVAAAPVCGYAASTS